MGVLSLILVNGEESACIDPSDRGLSYGHGLFETLPIIDGVPALWSLHWQRLQTGCQRLNIPLAHDLEKQLLADIQRLVEQAPTASGVIKITITGGPGGPGGRGYKVPDDMRPARMVVWYPNPDYPLDYVSQGVRVRTCQHRLSVNMGLAGLKHLNRLDQVLARAEWQDDDIAEGIMLDSSGNVIEGVMTNLFIVSGGELMTPDLSEAGVAGIMRRFIIESAEAEGIAVAVRAIGLAEALAADEVFLSNSLIGVWPVKQWDEQRFEAGPFTSRAAQLVSGHHAR